MSLCKKGIRMNTKKKLCFCKIGIISLLLLVNIYKDSVASSQEQPKKQRSWYQSFHIADYLPNFIAKRVTQWRVKRMLKGTRDFIEKLGRESNTWKEDTIQLKMDQFVTKYNEWIDQFYDIINEVGFIEVEIESPSILKERAERGGFRHISTQMIITDIEQLWQFEESSPVIRKGIEKILEHIREIKAEQ